MSGCNIYSLMLGTAGNLVPGARSLPGGVKLPFLGDIETHVRFLVSLLFVGTVAPFLPLLLTIMPLDQLIMRAIKIVF